MLKRILPYVGPLIGLIGVSLALYFHAQSVQDRKPLYYLGQRATIVDSAVATPSQLEVLYRGHPVGNTNVVEVVLYFWNGGKLPIRTEDVLEPVTIQLASGEILESRVLHMSRSVTKFEIHPVSESSKNVLTMSFGILERNDGAAIQLIYAGKSDTAITVNGTIVGAGTPRFFSEGLRLHRPEEALQKRERFPRVMRLILYLATVAVFIFIAVLFLWVRKYDQKLWYGKASRGWGAALKTNELVIFRRQQWILMSLWVTGLAGLLYLGADVYIYLDTHRPEVPYSLLGH